MNKIQEAFVHAALVVANLLVYKYIKDPDLAAIAIAGIGSLQGTLGVKAFNKNPDGTPARIAYELPKVEVKALDNKIDVNKP